MTLLAQFAATGGGVPAYIEDVFSNYIYTGNGSVQIITNGIDLSTKGGLVWIKGRNGTGEGHTLFDTARGVNQVMQTQNTDASANFNNSLTAFNTTGFTLGSNRTDPAVNFASWTFRKQPKFFDIVTYTGNGVGARSISHNLGAAPGCIMVKCTSTTSNWMVWHVSLSGQNNLRLNTTDSVTGVTDPISVSGWPSSMSTTTFDVAVGSGNDLCNVNGATYIAYLFANNAGGFGLTGSDNVISCGSYTGIAYPTSLEVNVGFEPQFVIIKNSTTAAGWTMWDVMRGMTVVPAVNTAQALLLEPNTNASDSNQPGIFPTATGFVVKNGLTSISGSGDTMVYIAIRRGPMKVPTLGTSVFQPVTYSGIGTNNRVIDTTITPDLIIDMRRENIMPRYVLDRLRGYNQLYSNLTNAESANTAQFPLNTFNVNQTGVTVSADEVNTSGRTYVIEAFCRAPSFFDEVCYTGNNVSVRTITHNLAAVPELMIVKSRTSGTRDWIVYDATNGATKYMNLNNNSASGAGSFWVSTAPTSTVFTVSDSASVNDSAQNYVAYLFATCAGVSKVGTYTGTGATQTINCGFTAGSRFVMIKRTDSTGDWYVWDSARGIIAGNDPYLLLNNDVAEVTGTDYVDTAATGFELSSTAPAAINANGGTYIFLAIA
jgi:hypothetical protein